MKNKTKNVNEIFSITAEDCKQIEKEYEIVDILIALHKAKWEVGDMKISEAIEKLSKKTRFPVQLKPYFETY